MTNTNVDAVRRQLKMLLDEKEDKIRNEGQTSSLEVTLHM